MKWREVIYDIHESIKQSYDDNTITLNHVKYWVSIAGSRLKMLHIDKKDSGAFLTRFNNVSVQIDTINNYKYFELPTSILDFDLDKGINYVSYGTYVDDCTPPFTSVLFTRTTPAQARVLHYTEEEKPTPSNPYFYRVGQRVYLLGVECIDIKNLEIGLTTTLDYEECDMDAELEFPIELLAVLQRHVFDIARFVLAIPTSIGVNDGTSDENTKGVPTNKLVSVADTGVNPQQINEQ